jgi:hypothetical protein
MIRRASAEFSGVLGSLARHRVTGNDPLEE